MPQLPQRTVDGYYAPKPARGRGAPALPVYRSKDLYRLPQGHRPPSARHAQCAWLAVVAVADVHSGQLLSQHADAPIRAPRRRGPYGRDGPNQWRWQPSIARPTKSTTL